MARINYGPAAVYTNPSPFGDYSATITRVGSICKLVIGNGDGGFQALSAPVADTMILIEYETVFAGICLRVYMSGVFVYESALFEPEAVPDGISVLFPQNGGAATEVLIDALAAIAIFLNESSVNVPSNLLLIERRFMTQGRVSISHEVLRAGADIATDCYSLRFVNQGTTTVMVDQYALEGNEVYDVPGTPGYNIGNSFRVVFDDGTTGVAITKKATGGSVVGTPSS
jgi:hypothetical protein